jgi:hypothetical protein
MKATPPMLSNGKTLALFVFMFEAQLFCRDDFPNNNEI